MSSGCMVRPGLILVLLLLLPAASAAPHGMVGVPIIGKVETHYSLVYPTFDLMDQVYYALPAEQQRQLVTEHLYEPGSDAAEDTVRMLHGEATERRNQLLRGLKEAEVTYTTWDARTISVNSGQAAVTDSSLGFRLQPSALSATPGTGGGEAIPILPSSEDGADGRGAAMMSASSPGMESPHLVAAMVLHAAMVLVAAFLFSRLNSSRLADHPVRDAILSMIENEPGIRLHEVAQRLGLRPNHADYHISMLSQHEVIQVVKQARAKHLFPVHHSRSETVHAMAIAHPKGAKIMALLQSEPGARLKDIQQQLGLSPSLAHWHVNRLVELGAIQAKRAGCARYFAAHQLAGQYSARGPLAQDGA